MMCVPPRFPRRHTQAASPSERTRLPASLIGLLLAGTAIGGLSLAFAWTDPGYAFAGDSLTGSITESATGVALITIGVAYAAMRPGGGLEVLLLTAGSA